MTIIRSVLQRCWFHWNPRYCIKQAKYPLIILEIVMYTGYLSWLISICFDIADHSFALVLLSFGMVVWCCATGCYTSFTTTRVQIPALVSEESCQWLWIKWWLFPEYYGFQQHDLPQLWQKMWKKFQVCVSLSMNMFVIPRIPSHFRGRHFRDL